MNALLTAVLDPGKRIVAIKALRAAAATSNGLTGMGLREAKTIVDGLCNHPDLYPLVQVAFPSELDGHFEYQDFGSPEPSPSVPRQDVLDLVFDVLSITPPETAHAILALPSYQAVKKAL